eukprot:Skav230269  [mRNA]  locus=scaffold3387:361550:362446:- [translate_table: standard]
MLNSASALVSYFRNMVAEGRLEPESETEAFDVEGEPMDESGEPVNAESFTLDVHDPGSRARFLSSLGFEPDPVREVGAIVDEYTTLPSVPPNPADTHSDPTTLALLETGDAIIHRVEHTTDHTGESMVTSVTSVTSSVSPTHAVVTRTSSDATGTTGAGAARAPKLTPKQRAAKGHKKIGIFTRHQIVCPQQPNGFMEVWLPQHGPHGEDFKRDMSNTLTLFRECGFKQEEGFRVLKTQMRRRGWKLLDHENMPGPGFVRMLPAEWGKVDFPLQPSVQRRLKMRGSLVQTSTRSRRTS